MWLEANGLGIEKGRVRRDQGFSKRILPWRMVKATLEKAVRFWTGRAEHRGKSWRRKVAATRKAKDTG